MMKEIKKILSNMPRPFLMDMDLENLLNSSADSRYGKVKRMMKQGELLHIRKGLYCLKDLMGHLKAVHPFELAQFIYGPSLISLESALSYHNLIPEAVYTTTSVTCKRTKEFKTPLGVFSFQQMPLLDLYSEVILINEKGSRFFIAKPWRAICDYVFCYRKDWLNLEPLIVSLRIDLDNLPVLREEEAQLLAEYYGNKKMNQFLKNIQLELANMQKRLIYER